MLNDVNNTKQLKIFMIWHIFVISAISTNILHLHPPYDYGIIAPTLKMIPFKMIDIAE